MLPIQEAQAIRFFTSVAVILCVAVVITSRARGDDDLGALIKAIKNGTKEARLEAFAELRDMGTQGRPAVGAILPFLRDGDADVREAAANALEGISPGIEAVPALLEAMRDGETGGIATLALVAVGRAAIPALTQALRDTNDNARSNAVFGLGELGPVAKDSMPALMSLFAKESAEVRAEIANTWAEFRTAAKSAIPLLVDSLQERSVELRLASARALWQIEGRPERIVPVLIEIVESRPKAENTGDSAKSEQESPVWGPPSHAAQLLGLIGPEARQAVPALIEATKAPDAMFCDCAIEALGEIGPAAKQSIPAIVERLGDRREANAPIRPHHWTYAGTWEVSITAWTALGKMGPEAAVSLIPVLKHHNKEVRQVAAAALTKLGPHAAPALDALVLSLQDPDEYVRWYSADAIGAIGVAAEPALPALLKAEKEPSKWVRAAAVDALPLIAPKSPAVVAALIAALDDSDARVRAHAAESLGKLGEAARPAVALMAAMLSSKDEFMWDRMQPLSECIASVLGDLGPVAKDAVPALVEAAGRTRDVNWKAIPALGKIGPEAKSAVPFLRSNATPEAVIAISRIDPDNAEIMPLLRQAWESEDRLEPEPGIYPDRSWGFVLGHFGPRASAAIPYLEKLLNTSNCRSRMSVSLAVLEIDPTHEQALDVCVVALKERSHEFPDVGPVRWEEFLEHDVEQRLDALMVRLGPRSRAFVPTLCDILNNPGKSARISAVERLAAIGSEAADAVPALIQMLRSQDRLFPRDETLTSKVATTLARIGPPAVPLLIQSLKDDDFLVREGAADALGCAGTGAASAVPVLAEALGDERMIVRASAAVALGKMESTAAPAVPALTLALHDEYSTVRCNAVEAMGAVGVAAQPASSAITDATRDEYQAVREAARAALRKIEPHTVPQG